MSNPADWTQVEKRMAFYAGIVKHGKLQVSHDLAQRWRRALPSAIELEYERIDRAELPRTLTVALVVGDGGAAAAAPGASGGEAGSSERAPGSG